MTAQAHHIRQARGAAEATRHELEELAGFARWALGQGGEVARRARKALSHETSVSPAAGIASCTCQQPTTKETP